MDAATAGGGASSGGDDLPTMTAAEYSNAVEEWLKQAYQWQLMAVGFPSYLAYQAHLARSQQRNGATASQLPSGTTASAAPAPPPPAPPRRREFRVPPMWKRFVAEFIDFLILFVVKLVVTFIAVDTFELIDMEQFMSKYDMATLTSAVDQELDVTAAFALTSDIVFLELIHRVIVCIFEAVCTYRGPMGTTGGATPGKLIMGLRIFRCEELTVTADPNYVIVSPASDLGIVWATLRAALKSFTLAFMFPISITFFFVPFNRTVYDVMSRSIVVEYDAPPRRRPGPGGGR